MGTLIYLDNLFYKVILGSHNLSQTESHTMPAVSPLYAIHTRKEDNIQNVKIAVFFSSLGLILLTTKSPAL